MKDPEIQHADSPTCPRRIELEQARVRELSPEQNHALLAHAETCAACKTWMQANAAAEAEFLARHPYAALARSIERRDRAARRRRLLLLRLAPACAAVALLAVGGWLAVSGKDTGGPGTRIKGEVAISAFLMRGGQIRPASADEIFAPNDRVQFLYSSGEQRYLLLLSIDDRGRVFDYTPGGTGQSAPIQPGERRPLPESIELDESPEAERVFAIFSDRPLAFAEVRVQVERAFEALRHRGGTVRDLARLPLPWPQASLMLQKR